MARRDTRISTECATDEFVASSSLGPSAFGTPIEFDRLQYKVRTLRGGTSSVNYQSLLGGGHEQQLEWQRGVRLGSPSSLIANDRSGLASYSLGMQLRRQVSPTHDWKPFTSEGGARHGSLRGRINTEPSWQLRSLRSPTRTSSPRVLPKEEPDSLWPGSDVCGASSRASSVDRTAAEEEWEAQAEDRGDRDPFHGLDTEAKRDSLAGVKRVSIRSHPSEQGSRGRPSVHKDDDIELRPQPSDDGNASDQTNDRFPRPPLSRASTMSRTALRERQGNLQEALEEYHKYQNEAHGDEEERGCIIHPDRPVRLTWDLIALCAITYQALTVPYELAFLTGTPVAELCLYRTLVPDSQMRGQCVFAIMSLLVDIFFLFDIFMNFVTGFYDKGTLVLDKRRCFWQYTKTWLAIDLLGIFPWRYASPAENQGGTTKMLRLLRFMKFIRLLKLLRVIKLRRLLIKLEDHLKSQYLYIIFQVIKLSLCLLLLCHVTACAWYGIGRVTLSMESERQTSWIQEAGLPTGDCEGECYGAALYFTMATMTTVGYGDIHAGNSPLERGVATLMLLAGTGVFAMLVSSIASLFQSNNSSASVYATPAERNRAALRYLWKTGVGGALTVELRKYLEQKEALKEDVMMEQHLRDNLSLSLLHDFCVESFRPSIVKFEFFRELRSAVIDEVCTICESVRFCPGEVVCIEGDDAEAMYFIKQGRVLVFRRGIGLAAPPLTEGVYFGEACLFTEHSVRQGTIVCDTFCELVRLDKAALSELSTWQDDLRSALKTRMRRVSIHSQLLASSGKVKESKDHNRLSSVCAICRVQGHYPSECPTKKLFDDPYRYFIIGHSVPELDSWQDQCQRIGRTILPSRMSVHILPKQRPRRRMVILGLWEEDGLEELKLMPRTHNLKGFRRSISEIADQGEWSSDEEDEESEEHQDGADASDVVEEDMASDALPASLPPAAETAGTLLRPEALSRDASNASTLPSILKNPSNASDEVSKAASKKPRARVEEDPQCSGEQVEEEPDAEVGTGVADPDGSALGRKSAVSVS